MLSEGSDDGGAGGRCEFHVDVDADDGPACQQIHDCGRRVRQHTVGCVDRSLADGDRAAAHDVHTERFEGCAHADDVHDGVQSADFMKVDLVGRHAVHLAFGRSQCLEDCECPLADPVGQRRCDQELADVAPTPVMVPLGRVNDRPRRR